MTPEVSFILVLFYYNELAKVAIRIDGNKLPEDCIEYYREHENNEFLLGLLPIKYFDDPDMRLLEVIEISDVVVID